VRKTVIVVALLLLAVLVIWLASRPDSAPQTIPETVSVDPSQVLTITLRRAGSEPLLFKRVDGAWRLANGRKSEAADEDAVSHLLSNLASMRVVRVVTRNPQQYEAMHVGESAPEIVLKDKSGNTLLALRVGKQGVDFLTTYIRLIDKPEVLAVNKVLNWQVGRSRDGWLQPKEPTGKGDK
jgi:hypothetical protein